MPQQDSVLKETERAPQRPFRIGLFVFLGALGILLGLNAALFIPYALAILMGVMLAVITRPAFSYFRRKGIGPKLSGIIVVAAILFLLIGPLSAFMTVAVRQAITLGQWLAERDVFSIDILVQKLARIGFIADWLGGQETIERQIRSAIQNTGRFLTDLAG